MELSAPAAGAPGARERSEEVYSAALRLFREQGYHATSMQDIASAVGLYKGSPTEKRVTFDKRLDGTPFFGQLLLHAADEEGCRGHGAVVGSFAQPSRWFFTNSRNTRAALASSGRTFSSFLAR